MQVDALALKLRPRSYLEAADLGVRLCQHCYGAVLQCYLTPLVPVTLACMSFAALVPRYTALGLLALWWLKPWLDRPVLFALSRAAFGQHVGRRDFWREQRTVLWGQLLRTLTLRRLSPWRSFTQPVYQLEGQRGRAQTKRVRMVRGPRTLIAGTLTVLFMLTEMCFGLGLVSLTFWLAPRGYSPNLDELLLFSSSAPVWAGPLLVAAYAAVLALCEPFYVAAGFGMYLNRRVELEAWDIEQEFRRAFAAP